MAPLAHFAFDGYRDSELMHTLFNQLMLERGFLATKAFYASYAHDDQHVDATWLLWARRLQLD